MENEKNVFECEWFKTNEKIFPRDIDIEFSIDVLVWNRSEYGSEYGVGYFDINKYAVYDNISDEMILKHGLGHWEYENECFENATHWTFLPKPPH